MKRYIVMINNRFKVYYNFSDFRKVRGYCIKYNIPMTYRIDKINLIDEFLSDHGFTRKDFDIRFKFKNKRYRIPAFNPLWWLFEITAINFAVISIYMFFVLFILIFS